LGGEVDAGAELKLEGGEASLELDVDLKGKTKLFGSKKQNK